MTSLDDLFYKLDRDTTPDLLQILNLDLGKDFENYLYGVNREPYLTEEQAKQVKINMASAVTELLDKIKSNNLTGKLSNNSKFDNLTNPTNIFLQFALPRHMKSIFDFADNQPNKEVFFSRYFYTITSKICELFYTYNNPDLKLAPSAFSKFDIINITTNKTYDVKVTRNKPGLFCRFFTLPDNWKDAYHLLKNLLEDLYNMI